MGADDGKEKTWNFVILLLIREEIWTSRLSEEEGGMH